MVEVQEQIQKILQGLPDYGVESSCVASRDGILIYSDIREGGNSAAIAAMSATILGAAEVAMGEFGKRTPESVLVKTGNGLLIVMGAGDNALLAVMTSLSHDVDGTMNHLAGIVGELKKILD